MEGLGRAGLEIVGSYPSPFVYIVKDEHSVAICEGLCCKGMHAMAAKACTGRRPATYCGFPGLGRRPTEQGVRREALPPLRNGILPSLCLPQTVSWLGRRRDRPVKMLRNQWPVAKSARNNGRQQRTFCNAISGP